LLRALREALPELKWRHQTPIGPFFADIMCFSEALVIEVDGDTHADTAEYDAARTKMIESEGFHVLRFSNGDVMENIDGVVAHVAAALDNRKKGSTA
jgi:very-short-patch-repair endonuclease